jgi:taurine dioxygenase
MDTAVFTEPADDLYADAGIQVVPMSTSIGAEIRGVDLAGGIDDETFAAVHRAWLEHLVIMLRGQIITTEDQIAFSRRFGQLDVAPTLEGDRKNAPRHPELLVISNVVEDGKEIGELGDWELVWHTDMDYKEFPPKASCLYAVEVPETGGDTGWRNMYAALETLPDDLRRAIDGGTLKHDPLFTERGNPRQGVVIEDDFCVSTSLGTTHPIIRTHPETGRQALYLGRRAYAYFNGLPVAESEVLLDALWAHVMDGIEPWFHQWRPGDLVLWDNRCAIHSRRAFAVDARRIMHRTQIISDERPY